LDEMSERRLDGAECGADAVGRRIYE